MNDPGDDGLKILRDFLARTLEEPEQRAHSARPQYLPLRFYRRRDPHPCYMRFVHGRPRCTN